MNQQKHFSPVSWDANGEPYSDAFGDVYHTTSGALEQAKHVFIEGCGLPERWSNTPTHTILETGFGLGLNFLATWQAWLDDPNRCDRLHFVSVEAFPVQADDIIKAVQNIPSVQGLAQRLASQYPITMPGIYRLVFEEEENETNTFQQVVLTLAFGDARQLLPQLLLQSDSIFLDGFSPAKNPQLWEESIFKAIAKLTSADARIATWSVAGRVRRGLQAAGFDVEKTQGLPPKRQALQGTYKPYCRSRSIFSTQAGTPHSEKDVIVIGAGLAGASVCWSLAQRGWQVQLIDQANSAAQGASGLPVGLALPHTSIDDILLSQLTRSGVEWLGHLIKVCQLAPKFWKSQSIEQLIKKNTVSCAHQEISEKFLFDVELTSEKQPCMRFYKGYMIEGVALVQALLRHTPGLQYLWNTKISRLQYENEKWCLFDTDGKLCATSPNVVVCSALDTFAICGLDIKGITPNRGQMTLGVSHAHDAQALPDVRTGHGHFIMPLRPDTGWSWSMGSTFDVGNTDKELNVASHRANYAKLELLSPRAANALKKEFENGPLSGFVEVRCTSADHLPLMGAVPDICTLEQLDAKHLYIDNTPVLPGLFMLASLGSRGLAVGPWCAEILASMMCKEPWPVTRQMARALTSARFEVKTRRHLD